MTPSEQETIISFNEAEGQAEIYTASARVAAFLGRKGLKPYKTDKYNGHVRGWFYRLPKSAVILKPDRYALRIGGGRRIDSVPLSDALGGESRVVS